VAGSSRKQLKKLNDKISDHGKCAYHKKCCEIIENRDIKAIDNSLQKSNEVWRAQNQAKVLATTRVFHTAYSCCLRNKTFTSFSDVLKLQKLNRVDVGCNLFSDHACHNIIGYIASKMRLTLIDFIRETHCPFSLMFDESTSVSTATCLILYSRTKYESEICIFPRFDTS